MDLLGCIPVQELACKRMPRSQNTCQSQPRHYLFVDRQQAGAYKKLKALLPPHP
jgi:hypothetical protein